MTPLQELLLAGARRAGWALTGASFAVGALSLRNPSPAPEVHVHYPAPAKTPVSPPAPSVVFVPQVAQAPTIFPAPPEPRSAPTAARSSWDQAACARARAGSGIQPTAWTITYISREEVDRILENQAELMRSARIVPVSGGDGRVTGVRLLQVRKDNLPGRLGFENGDLLQTVNGFDLTSPDKALEAYARLRSADELRVGIVRRGIPLTLIFRIC